MEDKEILQKIKSLVMKYEPCNTTGKKFNADSCWEHSCDDCLVPLTKKLIKLCKQIKE